MTIKTTTHSPGRAPFVRPKFSLSGASTGDPAALTTLPDLVEFNAFHNPKHPFCIQYGRSAGDIPRTVSCQDLYHGALRCSAWLGLKNLAQAPSVTRGTSLKTRPVAILMASDVGWFITFLALLRLGVPVLCLSTRLAPQAIVQLVHSTDTQAILISPQLEALSQESLSLFASEHGEVDIPSVHLVPSFSEFLDPHSDLALRHVPAPLRSVDMGRNAVIMHSSGSTGKFHRSSRIILCLPKPIFHSHTYLLGYAACHRLSARDVEGSINVSTLPLYHGFGQLAPSLSLAIGMPFALPSANTIPTGSSTLDILLASGATSLMTVPSILEELYLIPDRAGIDAMRKLRFVAVGGAPMKHSVAESLAHAKVPVLNHWGVTEIGAIAPIFVPGPDYDWRYLRVRDDIGLRFERIEGDAGHYRLVGCPPGTNDEFVVQDLLEVNPRKPSTEFRIAGRADDLIVLATGEKIRPTLLEHHVSQDPLVRGSIVFGDGRFQLGLIVEASPHYTLDLSIASQVSAYVDAIWPSVARGNEETDKHGRVSREMIIITTTDTVPLIRTPKGSIPRGENVRLFKDRVDEAYARADVADAEPLPVDDLACLQDTVRQLVLASFASPRTLTNADDFFEHGMDSLQATILRRHLTASMTLTSPTSPPLPSDIIYANPSVHSLCNALLRFYHGKIEPLQNRVAILQRTMEEWVQKVSGLAENTDTATASCSSPSSEAGAVVLLTGSTGSLGSALLDVLASSPSVVKIHALNRGGSRDMRGRQVDGLKKLGVDLGEHWKKVELHEVDLSAECFGLGHATYSRLQDVTHIIHNAWPMDFNRSLASFHPHLEASLNIIRLALSTRGSQPVRVLFSSSIAVVGRYPLVVDNTHSIPEATLNNPSAIDHFGYAEAKWVCERMFEEASRVHGQKLTASSVRIGQMTGSEATGAWNTAEHIPMLIKSCLAVRKIPDLERTASWIPVNRAAIVISEFLLSTSSTPLRPILHLENPTRQPWTNILARFASCLGLPTDDERIPFAEWLKIVRDYGDAEENPCVKITSFLESEFLRMATGDVVLDTTAAKAISHTLAGSCAVPDDILERYVEYWKRERFI
ncbi:hypothetical protein BC835DRAFT_1456089 [Cytidiella melzeri]|nr:hypothetical protein BC835DRAFT_1456089 [Cytidiella melzeri]